MQRIDLSYWYKLGETIHPLTTMIGTKNISEILLNLYFSKEEIESLLPRMGPSQKNALQLHTLLNQFLVDPNQNRVLETWEVSKIAYAAIQFETALKAELAVQPCYHVSPKGGYHVDVLTLQASLLFPKDLIVNVPGVEHDIEQAGKCLAFEVPTAAAFHLHRINEAVLHRYWDVFTKGAPRPENPSMGVYLAKLKRRKKKEAKLLAILHQIKTLHRNPSIHPDTNLTIDDAIELYGIIISSISRMLVTIRKG